MDWGRGSHRSGWCWWRRGWGSRPWGRSEEELVGGKQPRLLPAPSSLALSPARDGAPTAALGSLGQRLAALTGKGFFLTSNRNLPSLSWFSPQDWHSHHNILQTVIYLKERRIIRQSKGWVRWLRTCMTLKTNGGCREVKEEAKLIF